MKLKKAFYLCVSVIFLVFGLLGIVIPGLPTTPFLLVSAFCAAHGSSRFHRWMVEKSWYKKHVASYVTSRSMTRRSKVWILSIATTMILIAMIFVQMWQIRVMLLILIALKYAYFIYGIKTVAEPDSKKRALYD